jgi:hypothetical protein
VSEFSVVFPARSLDAGPLALLAFHFAPKVEVLLYPVPLLICLGFFEVSIGVSVCLSLVVIQFRTQELLKGAAPRRMLDCLLRSVGALDGEFLIEFQMYKLKAGPIYLQSP